MTKTQEQFEWIVECSKKWGITLEGKPSLITFDIAEQHGVDDETGVAMTIKCECPSTGSQRGRMSAWKHERGD